MADVKKLRKNLEREGFVTSYFETGRRPAPTWTKSWTAPPSVLAAR